MIVDEFPKLRPRLLDASGQLQHHLVVIHRDEILRRDALGRARVSDGEELRLTAAVSGGS